MTLLVRDEADIVDAQLAFHLSAGVDFVIATDNGSSDGTTEILERYQRGGRLHLIREPADDNRQRTWVTRMARLAATDFAADWVINADADEFWWPRGGTLKDLLGAVPEHYGIVRGAWRHFLPRPDDDRFFAERMTVRLRTPASPGEKSTIYHAHQKVAHRAREDILVEQGNHDVHAAGLWPLRGWYPLEILHFSFRSRSHFERKSLRAFPAWLRSSDGGSPTLHHELAFDAVRFGSAGDYYRAFVVDDAALDRGITDGTLAVDTRLRDVLRSLRTADGSLRSSPLGTLPSPDAEDVAAYVDELRPLVEIDGIVRAEQRVDALERRLDALETTGVRRRVALRASGLSSRRRLARR